MSPGHLFSESRIALVGVAGLCLLASGLCLRACLRSDDTNYSASARRPTVKRASQLPRQGTPYPRDAVPGGRDVETPYGVMRVYEWGPVEGEKVLLLHGVSAPVLTMSSLADELALRGFRVLIFDLFGRGYSENPAGHRHDMQLYTAQILLALASSPLPWTGNDSFHLIGYSFGGALSAAFTRLFPNMVKSVTLIAPGGLIRQAHTDWKQRLLYSTGLFPEGLLEHIVRLRLEPLKYDNHDRNHQHRPTSPLIAEEPGIKTPPEMRGGHDVTGGDSFDGASISKFLPGTTVEAAMTWQVAQHPGFIPAFMSSMRYAPIFEQHALWSELADKLRDRNARGATLVRDGIREGQEREVPLPIRGGKVLLVLGQADPVILLEELREDAKAVLGEDMVAVLAVDAGHELVMTKARDIAAALLGFWNGRGV